MNWINTNFYVACLFWFIPFAISSQRYISGQITDASNGQPVVGANIYIANTTVGTSSDTSGDYKLAVQGTGSIEIIVSCVGYKSFLYKIDTPGPLHQLDVSLEIFELPEVVVTPGKTHRQRDVNLFWRTILGVRPTRRGLEVLNPEKVYFYLSNDNVLKAFCNEPIEIVNHETGYHIRYVLQSFEHDYKTEESTIYGMPYFEELTPRNNAQQRRWERKRQEVYSVSLTRFMRALYRQNIHEEGFLLVKSDTLRKSGTFFEMRGGTISSTKIDSTKQIHSIISLTDILRKDQDRIQFTIDSLAYLACFAKPVTEKMIENSYFLMFESDEVFPVVILSPQHFTVFSDGTYSGLLRLSNYRNQLSGLSSTTPLEYGLTVTEATMDTFLSGKDDYSFESIQNSINRQLNLYPQEKLHLHIDRTMYVPGERIWFKAYLTDGFSHQPVANSRYVYVELISPVDTLVQRVMIRCGEDAMYHGHLFLSNMIPAGVYTIRAYTRYMENLGEGYFFTKNIQIGNLLPESGSEGNRRENRGNWERRGNRGSEDDYDVAFMPEGGNLLAGKLCKVAFKAQNRDGTPDYIQGELVDETGRHICLVKTGYAGMGSFAYIPERDKKYFLICTNRSETVKTFELPASQNTYSVRTAWRKHENLHLVTVEKSESYAEKPLYLLAHMSGAMLHFSNWDYRNSLVSLPGNELPSGIIQFVLFDEAMNPLSERLVFNKNMPHDRAEVVFSTDKPTYEKRDNVIVKLNLPHLTSLSFGEGRGGASSSLSVSITDDRDIAIDSLTTILSSLLLSSELKGHIETPAYYLQDNPYSEMALDLLMMTHGWRKYNIPEVVKGVYEIPQTEFEVSKQITGTVKSLYRGIPLTGSEVTIVSFGGEFDIAVTDSLGRFGVFGLEYPDSARFMVKAANRKGSENVELFMDEERFPKPSHIPINPVGVIAGNNKIVEMDNDPSQLHTDAFIAKAAQRAQYDEDIRIIHLCEVVVTARRVDKKDEVRLKQWQNRFSDNTIFRERIEDGRYNNIYELFSMIAGVVVGTGDGGDKTVTMRNERAMILIDGMPADLIDLEVLRINEVEAVDVFRNLNSAIVWGSLKAGGGVINITTRIGGESDFDLPRYNYATITPLGYQTPVEFYSPKYDTPESKYLSNPDYRTTIFWKPDIVISEEGKASFEFYTSDFPTTYSVVIEGISSDGKIIRHVDRIRVE